jgi:hypothetical protein
MTPQQVEQLLKTIAALGNGQQFTRETGKVWATALAAVPYSDAEIAVPRIAARSRYIDVLSIVQEVAAIRAARIDAVTMPLPNVDPDDEASFREEQRRLRVLVASGQWGQPELVRYGEEHVVLTPGARALPVSPRLGVGVGEQRAAVAALAAAVTRPVEA